MYTLLFALTILKFAAESFAFLLTKLSQEALPEYVQKIFQLLTLHPTEEMFDGTSQLFLESMKGSFGHFHSKMPQILRQLFRTLDAKDGIEEQGLLFSAIDMA